MSANASKSVYKLKHPIQYGTEEITELAFRRAKAKDFRGIPMEGANISHILDLTAKLAGVAPSVIDELDAEDLEAIGDIIGGFMPGGLEIGKTH